MREVIPAALRRVWRVVEAHPVFVVVGVAFAIRLVVAFVSFTLADRLLVPDEAQYVGLARAVASGKGANGYLPQFGQLLYDATWGFTALLAALFRLLWPSRFIGQVLAAGFGAASAGLTVVLVRRVSGRTSLAVGAGAVVALLPSQILWSSAVIRESMVWFALVACAVALVEGRRSGGRAMAAWVVLLVLSLILLGTLRSQTLVVAAWAVAVVAVVMALGGRRLFGAVGLVAAALVPVVFGLGIGGWALVGAAAPTLGSTRTYMSLDADSAFTPTTLVGRSAPGQITPDAEAGALGIARRGAVRERRTGNGVQREIAVSSGATYAADEGLAANVRALPGGLAAALLRPYPWEGGGGGTLAAAGVENLVWYVLYVLAVVGVVRWRDRTALLFPILVVGGVALVAALTEGNLGTAFRHRGQLLWALVLCASLAFAPQTSTVGWRRKRRDRVLKTP